MKKIIAPFFIATLLMVSCGNNETTPETDETSIKEEVNKLDSVSSQMDEIKNEIEESSEKLDELLNDL